MAIKNVTKKFDPGLFTVYILISLGTLTMVGPFIWMFLTSVRSLAESTMVPATFFPESFMWNNYIEVTHLLPFGRLFLNTAGMIIGRLIAVNLGWLDSIRGLILPGFVSAFGTFLLRQFFMGIPKDLEEAAIIDGTNPWGVYWRIMLPLCGNAMVSLGIFTALFAWKELMWPLIVNTSTSMFTLSSGLATLQGQFFTDYPQMMAGATIAIWPMLILFMIFQKQFVQGIASSGIKG